MQIGRGRKVYPDGLLASFKAVLFDRPKHTLAQIAEELLKPEYGCWKVSEEQLRSLLSSSDRFRKLFTTEEITQARAQIRTNEKESRQPAAPSPKKETDLSGFSPLAAKLAVSAQPRVNPTEQGAYRARKY